MSIFYKFRSEESSSWDKEFQIIDEVGHDLEQFLCRCPVKKKEVALYRSTKQNAIDYYEDQQSIIEYNEVFGTRERIGREIAFIELVTGGAIETALDLGCGVPYHLMALTKRGTKEAVGIDNSSEVHRFARKVLEKGSGKECKCQVDFRQADMRKLSEHFREFPVKTKDGFDVVMAMNGVAQLSPDDEDNIAVLHEMRANLSSSGKGILVFANRDDVILNMKEGIWSLDNQIIELVSIEYDPITTVCKQTIMRFNLEKPDEVDLITCFDKLYTYQDVIGLLDRVGLKMEAVFGDFDMTPFSFKSPWMIFVVKSQPTVCHDNV